MRSVTQQPGVLPPRQPLAPCVRGLLLRALARPVCWSSVPLSYSLGKWTGMGGCRLALAKQICREGYWLLLNQAVQLGEHGEADERWVTQALPLGTDLDPHGF